MPTLQEAREHCYNLVNTTLRGHTEIYYLSAIDQLNEPLTVSYTVISFIHTGSQREGIGTNFIVRSTADFIIEINVPVQLTQPESVSENIASLVKTAVENNTGLIFMFDASVSVVGRIESVWRIILTTKVVWYNT